MEDLPINDAASANNLTEDQYRDFKSSDEKDLDEMESLVSNSAIKRERRNFLNAFSIEDVWAEMEQIKAKKSLIDTAFKQAMLR